jgi:ribosome maturation factor RimP
MGQSGKKETQISLDKLATQAALQVGVELVELAVIGSGKFRRIRVDIDRPGPDGVGIDDCKQVSRILDENLDEADLFGSRYTLEVSSPGLDRPIRSEDDIRRNTGRQIFVQTSEPVEGRHEFKGLLLGYENGHLRLSMNGTEPILIPLTRISKASQTLKL